jgi:hypothetical protein
MLEKWLGAYIPRATRFGMPGICSDGAHAAPSIELAFVMLTFLAVRFTSPSAVPVASVVSASTSKAAGAQDKCAPMPTSWQRATSRQEGLSRLRLECSPQVNLTSWWR